MGLQGLYQIGYVTRDIDRAIAVMSQGFGFSDFSRFDMPLVLQTPTGARDVELRVATAWAGMTQIELIEPVSGYVDVYAERLPVAMDDATPQFHHMAVRRESPDEIARDIAALGLAPAIETSGGGLYSTLVDTRAKLGHYLEFVWATPDAWRMVGWPGTA